MMASLDISVAWSVAVPADTFGAHLQAYVQLQPTINTIRLCNRYGRGPKAAITKLPIELVAEIEHYVMDVERKKQRKHWAADFRCFQGLCKPVDHFSKREQVEMWNGYLAIGYHSDCSECSQYPPKTRLNKTDREELNDFLSDNTYEDLDDGSWLVLHEDGVEGWQGKAGVPFSQSRGILSTYSSILLKDFGLEMWVTHTQPKGKKPDPVTSWDTNVCASTVMYLTLPCSKTQDSFERSCSDRGFDTPYHPTENGGGVPVSVPGALSKADMVRFGRAIKTLDLTPDETIDKKPSASAKDENAKGEEEEIATTKREREELKNEDALKKLWSPKLRVLYRQAVDDEY